MLDVKSDTVSAIPVACFAGKSYITRSTRRRIFHDLSSNENLYFPTAESFRAERESPLRRARINGRSLRRKNRITRRRSIFDDFGRAMGEKERKREFKLFLFLHTSIKFPQFSPSLPRFVLQRIFVRKILACIDSVPYNSP